CARSGTGTDYYAMDYW
nr:immunoglobulin heavy chain junction region [Mus musculus]